MVQVVISQKIFFYQKVLKNKQIKIKLFRWYKGAQKEPVLRKTSFNVNTKETTESRKEKTVYFYLDR